MRNFALVALVCIAQVLAGPAHRDLASDVVLAESALARWDTEIVGLEARLATFGDEITITINDVYNDIKLLLPTVEGIDNATVTDVTTTIDDNVANASANVTAAMDAVQLVRDDVTLVNEALQGDLTTLAAVTDTTRADYDASNVALNDAETNVQAAFAETDAAIRDALNGLEGTPVVQILVSLQRVTDIVDNERFELTNARIIYDFRAEEAFTALQVVIDQV